MKIIDRRDLETVTEKEANGKLFLEYTKLYEIFKNYDYTEEQIGEFLAETTPILIVDNATHHYTDYIVGKENLVDCIGKTDIDGDKYNEIIREILKYQKTFDETTIGEVLYSNYREYMNTLGKDPSESLDSVKFYPMSVIRLVLIDLGLSKKEINTFFDNVMIGVDEDGAEIVAEQHIFDALEHLGYNIESCHLEDAEKKDSVMNDLLGIKFRLQTIPWTSVEELTNMIKSDINYAPKYANKVLKKLESLVAVLKEMAEICEPKIMQNEDGKPLTVKELIEQENILGLNMGVESSYNDVIKSVNTKSVLEYAKKAGIVIPAEEIEAVKNKNVFSKIKNKFSKKDKEKKEEKKKEGFVSKVKGLFSKKNKEEKEEKKEKKASKIAKKFKESKIYKGYESNTLQSLRYDFYKTCDKYGQIDTDKIKGTELKAWNKKNNKYAKKLEKYQNDLDAQFAVQTAVLVENYIKSAIEYDELGLVTNTSYVEYLKRKNMNVEELQEKALADVKLTNEQLNIVKDIRKAQIKAKMYADSIKAVEEELNKLKKAKKKRNTVRGILASIAAAITITTGAVAFNNINSKTTEKTTIENTMDNQLEENNKQEPEKTTEEKTSTKTEKTEKTEETGQVITSNDVEKEEIVDEEGEVVSAEKTISMAKKLDARISSEHADKKEQLENYMANLEETMSKNDETDIKNANVELLSYMNSIVNSDYIKIGSAVDLEENAKIYTTSNDMANETNAKNSYYGSNTQIGRTVEGVVLSKDGAVVIAHNEDEILDYSLAGYELEGYRIDNNYSYDQNGNYIASEGWVTADDAVIVDSELNR